MMHGWENESTDGPIGVVAVVAVVTSPTTGGCGVV